MIAKDELQDIQDPQDDAAESSAVPDAAAPVETVDDTVAPVETVDDAAAPVETVDDVAAPAEMVDTEPLTEVDELHETIGDLQRELQESRDGEQAARDAMLRAHAELENSYKRQKRDMENASRYALEGFLRELLPVLDSLELSCQAVEAVITDGDMRKGLQLTLEQFRNHLRQAGVECVEPVGQPFDPELHEAVSTQPGPGDDGGGGVLQVVTVLQKGYRLHSRLLRPARVVVAAAAQADQADQAGEAD